MVSSPVFKATIIVMTIIELNPTISVVPCNEKLAKIFRVLLAGYVTS